MLKFNMEIYRRDSNMLTVARYGHADFSAGTSLLLVDSSCCCCCEDHPHKDPFKVSDKLPLFLCHERLFFINAIFVEKLDLLKA